MNKITSWTAIFASVQWLFFIFANTVVVPISIGAAFDLSPAETGAILRSSLIVTGIACMLQGFVGHRYPLMEGHSGVMWGLVLNLSVASSSMGMSLSSIGGGIATGMILAGVFIVILGVFKLVSYIQKIFTPMVMSVYLFLLTFQLMIIFFTGMLKVTPDGKLDIPISLFSIGIVILVSALKIKGKTMIGNFSILIGMVVGWIFYSILFQTETPLSSQNAATFVLFPLGTPNLNIGIIAITFLASMINLSNTIASVQAASNLYNEPLSQKRLNRSYLLTGAYSIVGAPLGLVSYAPYASSIGFLESTRIFNRNPFLYGGGLMTILGIIPFMGALLATLPITVGNAVLFVAYLQLFGTSLKSLNGYQFNSITIHRLAGPILVGLCIMTLDLSLFTIFPVFLQPIISNGFIMGVLISIILEAIVKWDQYSVTEKADS
ncbi:uracil/xanthine transporter [Bacillus sp. 31A1R]|uniref:Uracil/xanthine transporter n=1 Tax=Robertmurraya mangrovi TaxID=3098077 RepID=A0ABU5J0C0_9BACI|nr:uracil/xanthine transporter [Bacillus sp. 31A1R]MDZ5472842.1 uracil/xanthine transporter [Bacillus sp. 31A1R]